MHTYLLVSYFQKIRFSIDDEMILYLRTQTVSFVWEFESWIVCVVWLNIDIQRHTPKKNISSIEIIILNQTIEQRLYTLLKKIQKRKWAKEKAVAASCCLYEQYALSLPLLVLSLESSHGVSPLASPLVTFGMIE